eukprot:m51a1_g9589 putative swi snf-related matrix-associated actin-dependent regulator of chromatin subfamily a containing dead h box 1 isoform x2 (815) ;mRNA; f:1016305-1019105
MAGTSDDGEPWMPRLRGSSSGHEEAPHRLRRLRKPAPAARSARPERPKRPRQRRPVGDDDDDGEDGSDFERPEDADDASGFFDFLRQRKHDGEPQQQAATAATAAAPRTGGDVIVVSSGGEDDDVEVVAETRGLDEGLGAKRPRSPCESYERKRKRARVIDDDDDFGSTQAGDSSSGSGSGADGHRPVLRTRSAPTPKISGSSDSDGDSDSGDDDDDDDDSSSDEEILDECEELSRQIGDRRAEGIRPVSLACELRPYQAEGVAWLYATRERGVNAILADEMGLGKTAQVIALLALLLERGESSGPHLIVVPATTLGNWERELEKFCPSLNVLVYYGSQDERLSLRSCHRPQSCRKGLDATSINVVLTTYNIAVGRGDHNYLLKWAFDYLVLDEAHAIKNAASKRFGQLFSFETQRRVLLTGTPLQNNLTELWSLLHFLMPSVITRSKNSVLYKQITVGAAEERLQKMKKVLSPFILRRLKSDVVAGEVAEKTEYVDECPLPAHQRRLYEGLMDRGRTTWGSRNSASAKHEGAEATEDVLEVSNFLMELRKMANHPLLCRRTSYTDSDVGAMVPAVLAGCRSDRSLSTFCGLDHDEAKEELAAWSDYQLHRLCCSVDGLGRLALGPDALFDVAKIAGLKRLLDEQRRRSAVPKVLVFSQMTRVLDILEEFLRHEEWEYVRLDGSTPVADRQGLVDEFNDAGEGSPSVFLLSTRAAGVGINLTAADTVIFYDCAFNPQVDRQAEDRCHRIGQDRPVSVHRLCATGTIDRHILELGRSKKRLNDAMLDEGVFAPGGSSSPGADPEEVTTLMESIFS